MEESLKKHPLLPSNYVSLQMLQERRIKEQQQKKKQVEEEEERKLRLEEERKRRLEEDERKRREEEEEEEEKEKRKREEEEEKEKRKREEEEEEKVRALQKEISLSNRRRHRYRKRRGKERAMKQEGGVVIGEVDEEKSEESKGGGGDLNGKVIRLKKKLGFQRKKKGLMDSKAEIERKDGVFAVVGGDDDDSKEVKLKVEEGGVNWKRSAGGTNERRRWSSRDKKRLETNSEVVVEPWPSVEIIRRIGSMTVTDDGEKVEVDIELLMGKSRSRSTMRVNSGGGGGGGKGEGEFSGSLRRSGYGRGSRRVVNCGGGGGDGGEFGGYRRRFGKDGNLMWVRKEESKDGEAAGSGSVRFEAMESLAIIAVQEEEIFRKEKLNRNVIMSERRKCFYPSKPYVNSLVLEVCWCL